MALCASFRGCPSARWSSFPHMMTPFVVGRESSVRALEEALNGDRRIFLATQHDASVDEPTPDDIYTRWCDWQHCAIGAHARRQHQGAGRGCGACPRERDQRRGRVFRRDRKDLERRAAVNARNRTTGCTRAPVVRAVWKTSAVPQPGSHGGAAHGRAGEACGCDCGESSAGDR